MMIRGPGVNESVAGEAIQSIAKTSVFRMAFEGAAEFAGFGGVAAATGWLVEWFLGPWISIPGIARSAAGMPSLSSVVLVVALWAAVGALYGIVAVVAMRRWIAGLLRVPGNGVSSIAIRPAWWARALRDAVIMFVVGALVGGVWVLGQWIGNTEQLNKDFKPGDGPALLAIAAILAIVAGLAMRFDEFVSGFLGFLKPLFMRSPVLWWIVSTVAGMIAGGVFLGLFVGLAFVAEPFGVAAGLGSALSLATFVGLLPLAAKGALIVGGGMWDDRTAMQGEREPELWRPASQDDFRNWDLPPETSFGGREANGYPFLIWRESADNRAGLSRPRYCCLTEQDGDLNFTFFDPSLDVRPTGALVACGVVVALVVIAALTSYWLTPRPYIPYAFDERPPPFLIFLSTAFSASMLAGLVGGGWFTLVTLVRWYRNRFEGDGRISSKPLQLLVGFTDLNAGEMGARINSEVATTGHGLIATFSDGAVMYLTKNAWDYPSIVERHRQLTNAFRMPKDDLVRKWDERQKRRPSDAATSSVAVDAPGGTRGRTVGVPDSL